MISTKKDRLNPVVDPLYERAVRIVIEGRVASVSLVQRRLLLGYSRAVQLFERMEAEGIVSSKRNPDGFRKLLILPFRRRLLLQQLRRQDHTIN